MIEPHHEWLRAELPRLVASGVLDADAAARLASHYELGDDARAASSRWQRRALAIFGALGAALIGGGLVLVLAHNWDGLPRGARIALAIVPLLATQLLAAFVLARRAHSGAWREAAGISVVMAVGASIALVSQTYHVPGTFADYLLLCLLLASPVAYVLDARLAASVFWAGVAIRAVATIPAYSNGYAGPTMTNWLLVAIGLPYLVLLARRAGREWRILAFVAAAALLVTGTTTFFHRNDDHGVVIYLGGLLAFFAAVGSRWAPRCAWARPLAFGAGFGLPVFAICLTFHGSWESLESATETLAATPAALVSIGVALAAGIAALAITWSARERRVDVWLAAAAFVAAVIGYAVAHAGAAAGATVLWNVWLGAYGLALTVRGIAERRFVVVNHGLIALTALLVARFFDTDLSFLARGVGFIVVGCAVLAVNALVARRKEMLP